MPVCFFGFISNITLFLIKLYVGLSSNSISIYSDGINNMFDGISALVTLICIGALAKNILVGTKALVKKAEELLSLMLCISVLISGVYFGYNSLERLMYPTPIWFSMKYLYILIATALAKLGMHFVYRLMNKKARSEVVRIMSYDCILDFFITSVTVVSLIASSKGTFSVDAFCGIFISAVIIFGAVKMLISHLKKLVGYVPAENREEIERIFSENGIDSEELDIAFSYENDIAGYISYENSETEKKAELLYEEIKKATDINLKTVKNRKGDS